MRTYEATVERDGRFWLVEIDGVGATQARNLGEVEVMAKDLVAVMEEVDPATVKVTYTVRIPDDVNAHLVLAESLRAEALASQAQAAAEVRIAAKALKARGVTLKDIGQLFGVSYQRAGQLASG